MPILAAEEDVLSAFTNQLSLKSLLSEENKILEITKYVATPQLNNLLRSMENF